MTDVEYAQARAAIFGPEAVEAFDRFLEAQARVAKARVLAPIETKLEKALARAFRLQGADFLKRFAKLKARFAESKGLRETVAIEDGDWEGLFTKAELATIEAFTGPLTLAVRAALLAGTVEISTAFDVAGSFDLANPKAVAYLKEHGADLVTKINDTTREYIKTVITQGVEQGLSYDKMAKSISDRYEQFAVGAPQQHIDSRAHLVAVTESASAYESGNRMVVDDLTAGGLQMEHSWLTVGDDRVSDDCQANQDQGWIAVDEAFDSGDDAPPAHPACRCTALYRRVGSEG